MKTKTFFVLALTAVSFWGSNRAQAGVRGPYAVDEHTLHLYHLDEPNTPTSSQNAVPGAIGANGLFGGASLSSPSYPAFGLSLHVHGVGGGLPIGSGDEVDFKWCGEDGAFTIEALICLDEGIEGGGNREIICNEDDDSSNRSFQFRINGEASTLEFSLISDGNDQDVVIVSTPIVARPSRWYHAAVTYNGRENTPDNTKIYWTFLSPLASEANLVSTGMLTRDGLSGLTDPCIGNELREFGGSTEGFMGKIDEIRISDIARDPSDMMFIK